MCIPKGLCDITALPWLYHAGFHAGIDSRGNVLNSLYDIQLEVGAFGLFRPRAGIKAGFHVVSAARRDTVDAFGRDVVICKGESIG